MSRKNDKSWFKSRGYLHITTKTAIHDKTTIEKLVKNPEWVAKHAFFPLLHKIIPQRRYKIIGYKEGTCTPIRGHVDKKGKSTKKQRPIHYATHIDSQIYSYYCNEIIQKKYEEYLSDKPDLSNCISAYRTTKGEKGKSNIHFAKDVFDFIKNKGECCALAFDIENFFNNLNHKKLKKIWANILGFEHLPPDHYNVFKSVTNFSYILLNDLKIKKYNQELHFNEKKLSEIRKNGIFAFFSSPTEFREKIKQGEISIYKNSWKDENQEPRGTVQGLPISAMLANLYLLDFDKKMFCEVIQNCGGLYRRYSDDIVVICSIEDKDKLKELLINSIKEFNLTISLAKTEECFFRFNTNNELCVSKMINGFEKKNLPFRYLGFEFYGTKTLIKVANISKFYRRMKQAIKTKTKRVEYLKSKFLLTNAPVFTRKLYRIYTNRGKRARQLPVKRTSYVFDSVTHCFIPRTKQSFRDFKGNFFSYVERAARIMNEPAIQNQTKRHFTILRKYLYEKMKKPPQKSGNWSKEENLEKW